VRQGWTKKKLGEVCEISSTLVDPRKPDFINLFHIGAGNMISGTGDLVDIKTAKEEELESGKFLFNRTTVLYSKIRPYLMKVARPKFDGLCSADVYPLSPDNTQLDRNFLFHLLMSRKFTEYAIEGSNRAGMPKVNRDHLFNFTTYFPPIHEQKRIVAILDEAFEGIDRAIVNTENNLTSARELFDSSLQFIFSNKGKDWPRLKLLELLERRWITSHLDRNHGGEYPRKDEFVPSGVPYISANCIKNERIDISLAKYLTSERASLFKKGVAKNNDVLFAHNATVGPVAILHTNERKIILSTSLTYYRCDSRYIAPEYLALYMRSNEFKQQYKIVMRQSTRNQVPITMQRTFYHIIPPIEEQQKIANYLDGLSVEVQRLEAIYRKKIAALNKLKQSILQKAFTGELTSDHQTTEAAEENHCISKDCLPSAEAVKQNVHPSGQLSLWS
jgi:type I restriction enzyme, S subunit